MLTIKVELYDRDTGQTYDITNRTLSILVSRSLAVESTKVEIRARDINEAHVLNNITITFNGQQIFKGFVVSQNDEQHGPEAIKFTTFECIDYSWLFNWRIVNTIIQSKTVDTAIKEILTVYVPEVTAGNVDTCDTNIEEMRIPYTPVSNTINDLLALVPDWYIYLDANNDVHFFYRHEDEGPELNRTNVKVETLSVTYNKQASVNRIWIIGAKQASANFIEQYYTGDGQQRYFNLAYEPNYTEIYVDSVLKNSKLIENDDGQQDFLIDKKNRVFFIPDNIATPFTGTIKAKYRPTIQLIDYFENAPEAKKLLLEKAIKNKDITDRLEARRYGRAEVMRRSRNIRTVSLVTSADISIGQKVYLNITASPWNVQGYFLVKSLSYAITLEQIFTGYIEKSVELEEIL